MITDAIRKAHVIGTWEERYRLGRLPDEDNHAALMSLPDKRLSVADRLALWTKVEWDRQIAHPEVQS